MAAKPAGVALCGVSESRALWRGKREAAGPSGPSGQGSVPLPASRLPAPQSFLKSGQPIWEKHPEPLAGRGEQVAVSSQFPLLLGQVAPVLTSSQILEEILPLALLPRDISISQFRKVAALC